MYALMDSYSLFVIIRKSNLVIILSDPGRPGKSVNYNDFIADFGEYLTEKYPQ